MDLFQFFHMFVFLSFYFSNFEYNVFYFFFLLHHYCIMENIKMSPMCVFDSDIIGMEFWLVIGNYRLSGVWINFPGAFTLHRPLSVISVVIVGICFHAV